MTRKVGYASPPDHSKWKPGQSGNPHGRRKGSVNFKTDLTAELAETIQVTEGGKPKRITKQRALINALTAGGIKGDTRAANILLGWVARLLDSEADLPTQADLSAEDRKIVEGFLERQLKLRTAPGKEGAK